MTVLRQPRQARSQASLRRIVDAARELLETEGFEGLTVARIARHARSSVGVFYSRFGDKRALLEHLAEVYAQEAQVAVQEFVRSRSGGDPRSGRSGLELEVRALVTFVERFHRERAGMLRALLQEARARPEGPTATRMRGLKALPPSLARLLLSDRDRIGHRDPAAAVAQGFFLTVSAVRERVLFGEGELLGEGQLAELLTAAWMALLAGDSGSGPGSGPRTAVAPLYS